MEKLLNLIMNTVNKEKKSQKILTKEVVELIEKNPNNYILGDKIRNLYLEQKKK